MNSIKYLTGWKSVSLVASISLIEGNSVLYNVDPEGEEPLYTRHGEADPQGQLLQPQSRGEELSPEVSRNNTNKVMYWYCNCSYCSLDWCCSLLM